MASGTRRAERFCWRERSDKINWRMLKALDLHDVVRRGDPALLEPYALHLTFARLPTGGHSAGDRDAWFVVRVFQLSMEYLLYMRSRDGDVLDSLFQELQLCEQERDEMKNRADKWKGRAASGERQVEKLHQVLQNIAKLLHIHGASPSAVATIETLLTELVAERRARQGQKRQLNSVNTDSMDNDAPYRPSTDGETRVCGRCGKVFSSALYLEKHVARRHSTKLGANRPSAGSPTPVPVSNGSDNNSDDHAAVQPLALQKMMQQFDQMLHSHEENFRMLSAQESNRVQHLYEQFHVEAQLVEELKALLLQGEHELRAQREALDMILREKSGTSDKLDELKDEVQRLTFEHKQLIDKQTSVALSVSTRTPIAAAVINDTEVSANSSVAAQDVKRLQETLEEVSHALEETRIKLSQLQTEHVGVIREKQTLCDRLDQARDKIERLENAAAAQPDTSPSPVAPTPMAISIATKDAGTQTTSTQSTDATAQTDTVTSASDAPAQPQQPKQRAEEIGTQTDVQERNSDSPTHVDAEAQTPFDHATSREETPVLPKAGGSVQPALCAATATNDRAEVPGYIQDMSSRELTEAVCTRSERAAAAALTRTGKSSASPHKPIRYSAIPRRSYLRSRFPHSEAAVKGRVAHCLEKLDAFAGRFGVSSNSGQVLSNDHLTLIRQALHAHLEVLPTDVLSRMVQCEATANELIETEWAPREKTRQLALEQLKAATQAKSELNQALVKQAMAALTVGLEPDAESVKQLERSEATDEGREASDDENLPVNGAAVASRDASLVDSEHLESKQGNCHRDNAPSSEEERVHSASVSNRDEELVDWTKSDSRLDEGTDSTRRCSLGGSDADVQPQNLEGESVCDNATPTLDEASSSVRTPNISPRTRQICVASHIVAVPSSSETEDQASPPTPSPDELDSHIDARPAEVDGGKEVGRMASSLTKGEKEPVWESHDVGGGARTDAASPAIDCYSSQVGKVEQERREAEKAVEEHSEPNSPWMSQQPSTSLNRSVHASRASELSMSLVASSELSFAASIPSLESEDPRDEGAEAGNADAVHCDEVSPMDHSDVESLGASASLMEEDWQTVDRCDTNDLPPLPPQGATDNTLSGSGEDESEQTALRTDSVSRSPPRAAPAFDDDDIEEIELA